MEKTIEVVLASLGLAIGGGFGIAGTFAPTDALRGLAWGIDGAALVTAAAVLTVLHLREGHDLVAAGFLVFAIGQGLILSGAATDLAASVPSFAAGAVLWSAGLALAVRLLGAAASIMLAATSPADLRRSRAASYLVALTAACLSGSRRNHAGLDLGALAGSGAGHIGGVRIVSTTCQSL